jgi:nitrite reductase (NO-forming)
VGALVVSGPDQPEVYSGPGNDEPFEGTFASAPAAPAATTIPARTAPLGRNEQIAAGAKVFARTCAACHQTAGQGIPNVFPPLAGSDFLLADKDRSIGVVLGGLQGPVTVSGNRFNGVMPSHAFLSDEDIADALTYVRNTWGNQGEVVSPQEVAARRARGTATVILTN